MHSVRLNALQGRQQESKRKKNNFKPLKSSIGLSKSCIAQNLLRNEPCQNDFLLQLWKKFICLAIKRFCLKLFAVFSFLIFLLVGFYGQIWEKGYKSGDHSNIAINLQWMINTYLTKLVKLVLALGHYKLLSTENWQLIRILTVC
jgi:hypothetical protein